MGICFLAPSMTGVSDRTADELFQECTAAMGEHVAVTPVRSWPALTNLTPSKGDAIVFFNRADGTYPQAVLDFLHEAKDHKAEICPIALTKNHRSPATVVSNSQSFDVVEELRQRGLTASQISTVALSLARELICKIQPTLSKSRMNLFISHRRLDGEEIAVSVYNQLRIRAQEGFRDLIHVRVGQDAQTIIEENLRASDVVVFLDTPKAAESPWIARELEMALSENIPIVWVRFGPEKGRPELKVKPAGQPHLPLPDVGVADSAIAPVLVDKIIDLAFAVTRKAAENVLSQIHRVKQLVQESDLGMEMIDPRTLLYRIAIPRRGFRYRQRAMTHLVQFFGRRPTDDDVARLWSTANVTSHDTGFETYDAAVLVGPIPGQIYADGDTRLEFIDSCDEYVSSLSQIAIGRATRNTNQPTTGGLIISGAFPDCEPLYQHQLTNAVHAIAETIFGRGATLIFGGHPTFQHLIFDMGKRRRPDDFQQAIHVYVSRYFVTPAQVPEMERNATVAAIPAERGNRDLSLTAMRKAMISDPLAKGLVVIGGKTRATTGRQPGVDEEIALARQAGLPIFLVGSVGGRSAEIATEYSLNKWSDAPNKLAPEENEYLMSAIDYHDIANRILNEVGL
jgi:hypothetical protein